MDQLWLEIVKQVPQLGVLVWVVTYFLRHMENVAKIVRESDERSATKLADVMQRNTVSMDQNTTALGKNSYLIDKYSKDFIERKVSNV